MGRHYKGIGNYGRAQEIIDNFSRDSRYLRSLIANVTDDGEYADSLDYGGLIREGLKIKAIASEVLKSKANKEKRKGLQERIERVDYKDRQRVSRNNTQEYIQQEFDFGF
ncbi:MAG: hypothetical protein Q7S27_03365 [Nanoarchaeota archaeon]|nr:hypothetical protein [Nanoarchaeota archaeon]